MAGDAPAAVLSDDDAVQPFMLDSSGIRGDLVRLGPALDRILTGHDYPEPVAALLGDSLTLAATLSSMMKYDGIFTLQINGDGPVTMIVADATSEGHLRGYAGFDGDRLTEALTGRAAANGTGAAPIADLVGSGYLAFTVDQGAHVERTQGVVELAGETLADSVQHYFRQSEQIRTGLMVAAERVDGAWRAGGLVLQRLPDQTPGEAHDQEEEDWRRAMILQASCTRAELLDPALPINDLLYRLFHEEGVRVFRRRALVMRCRCSRARLEATLRAMPRERIEELKVDGKVVATCQFCNRDYRFDAAALDRLYAT